MVKVGTLKELNVQPGDVVEYVSGYQLSPPYWWTPRRKYVVDDSCRITDDTGEQLFTAPDCKFHLISRASDKPKLWKDMTPEEKGALLLAYHEGKVIEWGGYRKYEFTRNSINYKPVWDSNHAYRVKPEPKVETVTLFWGLENKTACLSANSNDTHTITFNLIDGIPDCNSVKMEKL